jgi:hypothetical protein
MPMALTSSDRRRWFQGHLPTIEKVIPKSVVWSSTTNGDAIIWPDAGGRLMANRSQTERLKETTSFSRFWRECSLFGFRAEPDFPSEMP